MSEDNQSGDTGADAPKPPEPKPPPKKPPAKKPAVMETTPWESELTQQLAERFGDQITGFHTYVGQSFLECVPDAAVPILDYLKTDAGFDYLVDVTAVDYPKREEPRFDLVYILYSFPRNERIRVKTRIAEGEKPKTAVGVHLTADWLEREVYDMFGIEFDGHPNMKRILMPDEWEGWPLRKDVDILGMDNQWVQDNLNIESGQ